MKSKIARLMHPDPPMPDSKPHENLTLIYRNRMLQSLGAAILFLLAIVGTAPRVENVCIISEKTGEELPLKRPWTIPHEKVSAFSNGKFKITGELHLKGIWAQRSVRLQLGYAKPNFEGIVGDQTIQFSFRQLIDPHHDQYHYKRYVLDGGISIGDQVPFVLSIENTIGIPPHPWWTMHWADPVFLILWIGAAASACLFIHFLFAYNGLPKWPSFVVSGALLLSLWVLHYTRINERTYDEGLGTGVHSHYAIHIWEKKAIPQPRDGFIYYHSPLYYLIAAAMWGIAESAGVPNPYQALQALAVILFVFFLTGGVLAIFQWTQRPWITVTAVIAFCFWPSQFMHSVRTGNDSMLYALSAWAIFLGLRWWRLIHADQQASIWRKEWIWSAILASAAFYAKNNGIVVVAWLGILLLAALLALIHRRISAENSSHHEHRWIQRLKTLSSVPWLDFIKCGAVLIVVTSLFFGLIFARNLQTWNWKDPKFDIMQALVPNTEALNPGMKAETRMLTFLVFDPLMFMNLLHINPYHQQAKRYFWNYLFKTSLLGEYWIEGFMHDTIGWWLSFNFLVLFAIVLYGLIRYIEPDLWNKMPIFSLILLYFASIIYFRIKVHWGCANEFRYIFPCLIPMAILVGESVLKGRTRFRVGLKITALITFAFAAFLYWAILPEKF